MARVYPGDVVNNPRAWPRARRLDAIAVDLVASQGLAPTQAEAYLLSVLGSYRYGALAAYAGARPLYERALAIREKVLGPEHPSTISSLVNLAAVLNSQGDFTGARPLNERALAIRETALGSEHPDTASSLNGLARLLKDQGDLARARALFARALFARALAIREKALGPEHPDTILVRSNLMNLRLEEGARQVMREGYGCS
jgi:tetratricopeptide (TPR) repeat protein